MVENYKVITLCGSTRFKKEFMREQKRLTLEGNIVISVGLFGHSGDNEVWEGMDEDTLTNTKIMLDDMHKRKIDIADEIFVINVDGYIGDSTKSEIDYAKQHHKKVRYLVHPLIGKCIKYNRYGSVHIIKDVTDFDEDTFGQGNFAVSTEDGKYLYECEIKLKFTGVDNMRKITKILLNVLKFIFTVLLFIALLTFITAWSATE